MIIAGRGRKSLDGTTSANPGVKSLTVDMTDAGSIAAFAARLADDHPGLNVLVNNAGIMAAEDLLPTLRRQPCSTIMNVSSGLAFAPMAMTPS